MPQKRKGPLQLVQRDVDHIKQQVWCRNTTGCEFDAVCSLNKQFIIYNGLL